MSLQGNFRQVGLADLLQSALAGRRGNFHIHRGGRRALLHLEDQQLRLIAPDSLPAGALLQGLIHRGLLDETLCRKMTEELSSIEALDHFLETGVIPADEVERLIREASEDAILDLLTWQTGSFTFQETEPVPEEAGLSSRVAIDMGSVLLLAAKRKDEQAAMEGGLGLEPHLFVPLAESAPEPGFEGDPVGQVHALLDGVRVTDEIATLAGLTRFDTIRAILACVESGAARLATGEELWHGAAARLQRGETQAAQLLIQQWTALEPDLRGEVSPGAAEQVLRILKGRLTRHPGEVKTLSAMAAVAEAGGDVDLQIRTTVTRARLALDEEEAEHAATLLEGLGTSDDMPLDLRVLRGRAFFEMGDKERLVAEAEAVRDRFGTRCRGDAELEAAKFFRGAVATLAPERVDLGRELTVAKRLASPLRRFGPIAALLLLAAAAAAVFWPEGPGAILERAQAAVARGDHTEALHHVSELLERHPETPEAQKALAIRDRLPGHLRADPSADLALGFESETVQTAMASCEAALARLPDPAAREDVTALNDLLRSPEGARVRREVLGRLEYDLGECAERISRELRARADTLARAPVLAAGGADEKALRELVAKVDGWARDGFAEEAAATVEAFDALLDGSLTTAMRKSMRKLENALEDRTRGVEEHGGAVDECRRALMRLDIRLAYERCVSDGARLFADGRLDEAAACYDALGSLLQQLDGNAVLEPLTAEVAKKGMPRLLAQRRETLTEIRRSLDSAEAAERTGNLTAAIEAYANLSERFRNIRFENVIRTPLRVRTIPSGAEVSVNGVTVGTAPLVVHYPWNTRVELSAARPGYDEAIEVLAANLTRPPESMQISLPPQAVWSIRVESAVASLPAAADHDLVVCDRTGQVHLYRGADGEHVWSRRIDGVDDLRARPVSSGGLVYIPLIDGQVHILEMYDGRVSGSFKVGGNLSGSALLDDLVGVVSLQGELVALRGRNIAFRSRLGATPSAGLIAAHGAFWIGTDDGNAVRLDPKDEQGLRLKLGGRAVPIRGLASHAGGVLLAKADGTLHALKPDGSTLWMVDAVGDVIGAPAAAGGKAACVDTRGRVMLFDLADGTPRGQVDLGGRPKRGFLPTPNLLVTLLVDGRLWIYDPAAGAERAFVNLGGESTWFGAAAHGDEHLVVAGADQTIRLLRIPAAPSN